MIRLIIVTEKCEILRKIGKESIRLYWILTDTLVIHLAELLIINMQET